MTVKTITIATRESKLALWQAHFVRDQLLAMHPDLNVELLGMTTRGDQWLQSPLSEIGGKGLFIKELEVAMNDGRADIAVHSVKDLPAQLPAGFALPVLAFRDQVNDVLVGAAGGLDDLPQGAVVGSSSLRRQSQLKARRPDLDIRSIRGNVGTRLSKLDSGEFDAIVLAAAGLNRLDLRRADVHTLPTDVCLPAPGQGALGIECRADSPALALLEPLKDEATAACVKAERGISAGLGADCSLPVAALAGWSPDGTLLELKALLASADGTRILRAQASGTDPHALAGDVVAQLYELGAQSILDQLRA